MTYRFGYERSWLDDREKPDGYDGEEDNEPGREDDHLESDYDERNGDSIEFEDYDPQDYEPSPYDGTWSEE